MPLADFVIMRPRRFHLTHIKIGMIAVQLLDKLTACKPRFAGAVRQNQHSHHVSGRRSSPQAPDLTSMGLSALRTTVAGDCVARRIVGGRVMIRRPYPDFA